MRSVGLKALENELSEYVRLAAGGETVLVTDRDRVVAELSMDFLRAAGQVVELASHDRRLVAAARGMKLATLPLG